MMMIRTSQSTAAALSTIGIGDFTGKEEPERMAWVVLILRRLDDRPEWFPRGKWATIQSIDDQLQSAAIERAGELAAKVQR
jgi:hypothetical protein